MNVKIYNIRSIDLSIDNWKFPCDHWSIQMDYLYFAWDHNIIAQQ